MNTLSVFTPIEPAATVDPRSELDANALVLASRNAFPVVASQTARKDGFGLAAGGAVALLLGGLTFWSMSGGRTAQTPLPKLSAEPAPLVRQVVAPPPLTTRPVAAPAMATAPITVPTPLPVDHIHAPVMVFDMSGETGTRTATAANAPQAPAKNPLPATGDNEAFAQRVSGVDAETVSATRMADPASTVAQGTLIAAVLETAIDSDLPGYVRAIVSRDVKSFDSSTVLIPRSSRVIGQYKSGLAAGQTRAYVVWTRLIRPDGVSIPLGSPGIDYAGRSGLAGQVDGHFMKRFGSAMLLSVVGGLGALGSGGTSLVLSAGGNSAASVAAQRDAQIPPTIRVRQGEPIRIFTARDLDFSTAEGG